MTLYLSEADVQRLLTMPLALDSIERAMQDHWMSASAKCKDVVVLAMPLKDVPLTKEAFSAAGAHLHNQPLNPGR